MKQLSIIVFSLLLGFQVFSQVPKYFFIMLNTNPNRPELSKTEVDKIQAAHMANMDSLAGIGQLLAAGPFHEGGGLLILRAESLEAADTMLKSDPAVKANRFIIELYPLEMIIGSMCPVKENYEMVEYTFIKYMPVQEKFADASEKKISKLNKRHSTFLTENMFLIRLIAAGGFGSSNGGFLITEKKNEKVLNKLLLYDPWTKSGYFTAEQKALWIAGGSFCEESY